MKRALIAFLACILMDTSLYAACKTEACRKATAWKNGYTAVVLDDEITETRYHRILAVLKAEGDIVAIEAENVLLGWIKSATAAKIRREDGVRAVAQMPIARPDTWSRSHGGRAALVFFNSVLTGEHEDKVEAGLSVKAEPLTGCVAPKPVGEGFRAAGDQAASSRIGTKPSELQKLRRTAPTWDGLAPHRNPDMRGRVTVQVFRVDSTPFAQPSINEFTWTQEHLSEAYNQVLAGYTFWAHQATQRNPVIPLSFRVKFIGFYSRISRTEARAWVQSEPIRTDYDSHHLWINDALGLVGFGTTSPTPAAVFNSNEAYNLSHLNDFGGPYDRSFSMYVVYNPPDLGAPASFPYDGVGPEVTSAYSNWDGPYVVVMWNSNGWQPENLNLVVTHEAGHIFWACDEYATACNTCLNCVVSGGPRSRDSHPWITNGNCQNNGNNGSCSNQICVMRDNSHELCAHTPAQIGW